MHLAAKHGYVECLSILLEFGAELYCEDFRKWNILHYASFHGHKFAVRFISKYDSDMNILQTSRNSQNKLPIEIVKTPSVKPYFISLWQAAKDGDLDMIRQVLNDGEDINEQTTFLKNSALHLAVLNNHYLAVRLLLEMGCNPLLRNKDDIIAGEYADIINNVIITKYQSSSNSLKQVNSLPKLNSENLITIDKDNELVDLRDFVRNVYSKNEKTLNSTITSKSYKLRFWNVQDFSNKIKKVLSPNSF